MHIDGLPVKGQITKIRKSLGVCPQLNTVFSSLTPTQHFALYGKIRGLKSRELTDSIQEMLKRLQLQPRAHTKTKALSGGQKRKVCRGNANDWPHLALASPCLGLPSRPSLAGCMPHGAGVPR